MAGSSGHGDMVAAGAGRSASAGEDVDVGAGGTAGAAWAETGTMGIPPRARWDGADGGEGSAPGCARGWGWGELRGADEWVSR